MQKPAAVLTGIVLLAGGYWLFVRSAPDHASTSLTNPTQSTGDGQAPASAPAEGSAAPVAAPTDAAASTPQTPGERPLQVGSPTEHPDWIRYPDGTACPPLNGVTKAPQLIWHRSIPFTKVVRIEQDRMGRDWYVHENGVRSTTYLDGQGKPIGDLMMDSAAMPILDDTKPK